MEKSAVEKPIMPAPAKPPLAARPPVAEPAMKT
jgi:hypothetical protein